MAEKLANHELFVKFFLTSNFYLCSLPKIYPGKYFPCTVLANLIAYMLNRLNQYVLLVLFNHWWIIHISMVEFANMCSYRIRRNFRMTKFFWKLCDVFENKVSKQLNNNDSYLNPGSIFENNVFEIADSRLFENLAIRKFLSIRYVCIHIRMYICTCFSYGTYVPYSG